MKAIKYYILFLGLTACNNTNEVRVGDNTPKPRQVKGWSFKSYKITSDYFITDTGYFNMGIGDGVYAVVKENNRLVDTIELSYGVKQIDEGRYMYHTIIGDGLANKGDANPNYKKSIMANLGYNTIVTIDKKKNCSINFAPISTIIIHLHR